VLILAEVPTPLKIAGAALVLAGIYLTTRSENQPTGTRHAK
jgi:drug/metabolite transporter (DMT)-like permease